MPNELWPSGSVLFGWVSVLPLLFFTHNLQNESFPWTWGALWGVGFTGFQYFWLSRFGDFSLWTLGGVALVYALYGSLFIPILSFVLKRTTSRVLPLVIALTLVGFEYLRSIGYLAFPWNLSAHPFARWAGFIQIVDLGGVFLLGFVVLFFQGSLFLWIRDRTIPWASGLGSVLLILFTLLYGGYRLQTYDSSNGYADSFVDFILVQQNEDSWSSGAGAAGLARIQELTLTGLTKSPINLSYWGFEDAPFSADLAVWSETSLAYTAESLLRAQDRFPEGYPFADFMTKLQLPLLTGAPVLVNPHDPSAGLMNGAVFFDLYEDRPFLSDTYGKQRLIPFAEHVPIEDIPFLARFLEERIGISASGWVHGPDAAPMSLSLGNQVLKVGIPICFEDSFFQQVRQMTLSGSQLFINLTNNSWSGTFTAHGQHTAAAIFRTVETRRTMIRSTNSGLTSIIGPQGSLLYSAPEFTTLAQPLRVPLQTKNLELTFYTRMGDWFAQSALLFLLLFFLWDQKKAAL
ncbi:MAG: apolipoprotein N-acyltransferase [Spirochaetales bacterium]|nr:apolipoprotein N-acyltransferase [Spirochaetales bacterium]